MSARFTKLDTVNLADEDSDVEEAEEEREGDDYQVKLVVTDAKKHRRWAKRGRRGNRTCVCFSSWRWVLIALIAFSVSIIVSLVVAKLASEPPQVKGDAAAPSRGGCLAPGVNVEIVHS